MEKEMWNTCVLFLLWLNVSCEKGPFDELIHGPYCPLLFSIIHYATLTAAGLCSVLSVSQIHVKIALFPPDQQQKTKK